MPECFECRKSYIVGRCAACDKTDQHPANKVGYWLGVVSVVILAALGMLVLVVKVLALVLR